MKNRNTTNWGYVYALQAFVAWGILPVFWKLLAHIPAMEVLAHRIFWSFFFLAILLMWRGKKDVLLLFRQKKTRNSLIASSILIAANWGLFIYAVNAKHIVEASLGYYINPIVNVILGMLILNEKLDRLKYIALLLATASVIYLTIDYGKFPWISILLALSFGLYGLVKKTAGIEAIQALTAETFLLAPLAALYIGYKLWDGSGALFLQSRDTDFYLIITGIVTSLPLYWFAKGTQRIPLSAVGFMQYIGPTLMLLLGVLIYNESFRKEQVIAFGLIWIALALYSSSMIINTQKLKKNANSNSIKKA